jgi:hypothetical protein
MRRNKYILSVLATLLIAFGCILLFRNSIDSGEGLDPNPYSDISSNELANQIRDLVEEEGWHIFSPGQTERLASEALSYEDEEFRYVDHVIGFQVNSMTIVTWIVGQNGAATEAHVRMYGNKYDLSYEKLFDILRPVVPFSSAGRPPLNSQTGEQVGDGDAEEAF